MSTIFGVLNISDRDATLDTVGQRAVWEVINQYAAATEAELDAAYRVFVQEETDIFKETYFLPGGGMLQDAANRTRPGATKPLGKWDVAYPIEDGRTQIAWDDVAYAYLTPQQADAQVRGAAQQYLNWKRYLILRALLNKTDEPFTDPIRGDLTIRRLANGDAAVLFPPVIGSSTEATENHYIGTNYTSANISDTNNPLATIRSELNEHYGGGRYIAWINEAQRAKIGDLTAFYDRVPAWVNLGADTSTASAAGVTAPGTFVGAGNDVAVFEWNWIPADYMFGLNIDAPAPLKKRVDVPASLRGFRLIATQQEHPLEESFWRAREGYGVGNRLNGVALHFNASTTYTTPAAYA